MIDFEMKYTSMGPGETEGGDGSGPGDIDD